MSPLFSRGRSLGRAIAAGAVGVLAATLFTMPASAGAPSTLNESRASAAAGWLARQMVDGSHFEADFGGEIFPDQGLTLDAVLAFAASHSAGAYQARAMAWIARPAILSGYVGNGAGEAYAGATAKLALAVEVRHGNASSFGGENLIAVLRSLRQPSGQFKDRSAFGDFSNSFSQSLAILALARTPNGVPAPAATFLANTRCSDGGFPLDFNEATCTSEADSTALAVQALTAAGRSSAAATGIAWLLAAQQADGGFVGVGGENANSTGLAAQTLWAAGRPVAALRAMAFLRGLQVNCSGAPANRGAIKLAPGPFDRSTAPRATAQAVLGLAGVGFADLDSVGSRPGAPVLSCSS